jgi:hypothetical protein
MFQYLYTASVSTRVRLVLFLDHLQHRYYILELSNHRVAPAISKNVIAPRDREHRTLLRLGTNIVLVSVDLIVANEPDSPAYVVTVRGTTFRARDDLPHFLVLHYQRFGSLT